MRTAPDDRLWSAISDPSRRRVLDLLVHRGAASASALSGQLPFSRQAVSKHLGILEKTGLVSRRKAGREVRYEVDPERLETATRLLAQLASEWDRRLDVIKRLAEAAYASRRDEERMPSGERDPTSPTSGGPAGAQ